MSPRPSSGAKRVSAQILASVLLGFAATAAHASDEPELTIYTYDSLVAAGGFGSAIFPLFEKKFHCHVRALASGDGGQLLSRLQIDAERGKSEAQLVVGLDEPTWERAKPYLDLSYQSHAKLVNEVAHPAPGFVPYDFGFYSFIYDRESKLAPPAHLTDILKPEWHRNFILEDPRTSMPGTAFVLYFDQVVGAGWKYMRSQWLTLAPGWDAAYGLFLKGEAPMVWSYTTSQAYHEEHGSKRYQALVFEEGQPIAVEGASLIKGTASKLAREFLEFLVSPEAQAQVAKTNWMFPALRGVKLPESFKNLPKPKKVVHLPTDPAKISAALADWAKQIQ